MTAHDIGGFSRSSSYFVGPDIGELAHSESGEPGCAWCYAGCESALTSKRLDVKTFEGWIRRMEDTKRATVYFDASLHQALRIKAAATDRSISEMVNAAVRVALAEDADDLAAFEQRRAERSISFESVVRDLRKRGRI